MINLQTETREELNETKMLAEELGDSCVNSFSMFAPYPRTKLYDYVKENYPNTKLPTTLKEWADINWFNYMGNISELSIDDITSFCKHFNVTVFEKNELHKTSI